MKGERNGRRGCATAVPFVPGDNKRCFHPRDVVKLLSGAIPSACSPARTATLSSRSFLPRHPLFPRYPPRTRLKCSPTLSRAGFAKMIYDRLRSALSLSLPVREPLSLSRSLFSGEKLSREHLHHLGASGERSALNEEDSDLNGLRRRA